jgi:cytochrome P450
VAGRTDCVGKHFAYTAMNVMLTTLLQRFVFELVDGDPRKAGGAKPKWPENCRVRYQRR